MDKRRRRRRRNRERYPTRRVENRILFLNEVRSRAVGSFIFDLQDALARGHQDIVLDFSAVRAAFLDAMVGIVAVCDWAKREGVSLSVMLPTDFKMSRLFDNARWAYMIDPGGVPKPTSLAEDHLPLTRFTTASEQHALVKNSLDRVLKVVPDLTRDVMAGMEWAFNEITDNVLNHADCSDGGLVQLSAFRDSGRVSFVVADSGLSIPVTLRGGHPDLERDELALGEAIKSGVTRSADVGQGNGLAGSLRIATMSGGEFEVYSGQGKVHCDLKNQKTFQAPKNKRFPGTLVSITISRDRAFDISEALGFGGEPHEPVDFIELEYEGDDALGFKVADEAEGLGNRVEGRRLRTKCLNLMGADPASRIILDFTGVPMLSSSCADEFVGRMVTELGFLAFNRRVRLVGVEPLVSRIIERAVYQRCGQHARTLGREGKTERPKLHANPELLDELDSLLVVEP